MARTNLAKDVFDEVLGDKSIDSSRINVTVDDGNVVLSGVVGTFHEKDDAATDAWRVRGVNDVKNNLAVDTTAAGVLDAELITSARAGLDANGLIPQDAVAVAASDGWVTMTGSVRHNYQRMAAEHIIRHLRGLQGFTDNVVVDKTSTKDVAKKVSDAYARNAALEADSIKVANADGVVTLAGTVRSVAEKQEAERTAWRTSGVTAVNNKLLVRR
jgi:osmotically-inducible protein OsmY